MQGFGAFGKIPALGDFLRFNLPADFVREWDAWLQESMLEVKSILEASWNEAYLSAPIWRFTLPAGFAGPQAISGVLMASIDRVGRQYPLTLAFPHQDSDAALTHFANRTVFETLETIALASLDDASTRDTLTTALDAVTWINPKPAVMEGCIYVGAQPAAQTLAAQSLHSAHGNCALWSAMLEENHRLMVTQSLPKGHELVGLFDLSAAVWTQTRPSLVM